MTEMLPWTEILIRLTLAAFFGALIGVERERKDWAAGLRTHMMVCVGASLTMMVSSFGFMDILGTPNVNLDPSRVAAQVISGIGFLGAGTILFLKPATIKGLTTASGLWTVAGIGLATGGGMYFAAIATTIIAIIILWVIQLVQQKLTQRFSYRTLRIVSEKNSNPKFLIEKIWEEKSSSHFQGFSIEKVSDGFIIKLSFQDIHTKHMASIIASLQEEKAIKEIEWTK